MAARSSAPPPMPTVSASPHVHAAAPCTASSVLGESSTWRAAMAARPTHAESSLSQWASSSGELWRTAKRRDPAAPRLACSSYSSSSSSPSSSPSSVSSPPARFSTACFSSVCLSTACFSSSAPAAGGASARVGASPSASSSARSASTPCSRSSMRAAAKPAAVRVEGSRSLASAANVRGAVGGGARGAEVRAASAAASLRAADTADATLLAVASSSGSFELVRRCQRASAGLRGGEFSWCRAGDAGGESSAVGWSGGGRARKAEMSVGLRPEPARIRAVSLRRFSIVS